MFNRIGNVAAGVFWGGVLGGMVGSEVLQKLVRTIEALDEAFREERKKTARMHRRAQAAEGVVARLERAAVQTDLWLERIKKVLDDAGVEPVGGWWNLVGRVEALVESERRAVTRGAEIEVELEAKLEAWAARVATLEKAFDEKTSLCDEMGVSLDQAFKSLSKANDLYEDLRVKYSNLLQQNVGLGKDRDAMRDAYEIEIAEFKRLCGDTLRFLQNGCAGDALDLLLPLKGAFQ